MFDKFKERYEKRQGLISPNQRGYKNSIIRWIKGQLKRNTSYTQQNSLYRPMSIFVTTTCNLNCYSCGALGMNPRPKEWNADPNKIELFLKYMVDVFPEGSSILLTGGEPTLYPHLKEVCDMIHEYGFKTSMLTNCAVYVEPSMFDYIILDYHGVNRGKYDMYKYQLDKLGIPYESRMKDYHQDILYAMDNNITKGIRCSSFLKPYTLYDEVVYPCCNAMCVEWWKHTNELTLALIDAGWYIGNPDLSNTLKNWRETLPSEFYRFCTLNCWRDANKAKWVEIG